MECLRFGDLKKLLNCAEELLSIQNLVVFPSQALVILKKLIPSKIYYSFTELSLNWKSIATFCDPFETTKLVRDNDSTFDVFVHEHPLVNHIKKGFIDPVIKLSDLCGRIRFHNMGLYTEYYKKTGVEFQMSFCVPNPQFHIAFGLNRNDRDFTERERLLLILFRVYVILNYRHLNETARFLDMFTLLQTGIEADGRGLVLLSMNGEPCFTSDRARQWLNEYFQSPETWKKGIPFALSEWVYHQATIGRGAARIPFVITRKWRRLHISFLNGGNQGSILLLTEENADNIASNDLLRSSELTHRETEVLAWISRGKTSQEIGKVLGLSFRTIDKHIEHIYVKLGVENRAAAAACACQMNLNRNK